MTAGNFADSHLRIQWAKEGLADFQRCANSYFRRAPHEVRIDPDPDGIHEHHKLIFNESLPMVLTKYAVYVVEDLRSALDLAARIVARLAKVATDDDIVYFPFSKLARDFKSRLNSCCKGFPEEIKDLFASYEPYSDGSELLFAINTLCNASKHRIIVPVASFVGTSMSFESSAALTSPIRIREGFSDCENEMTFATTQRGLDWKYQTKFSFGIGFGKIGAIEGRDVKANLGAMIKAVEIIVNETEAKSRVLGLLT